MTRRISPTLAGTCLAVTFGAAAPQAAAAAVIADYAADFSTAQNPNGAWTYGYAFTLGGAVTQFGALFVDNAGPTVRMDWNTGPRIPLAGILIPSGGTPIGVMHPGGGTYAVAVYTMQAAATGLLDVLFQDADHATTDVHVLRNGVSLFDSAIGPGSLSQGYQQTLSLAAGDTLAFVVGQGTNGSTAFDTTYLTATLTDIPEPASMAALGIGLLGLAGLRRRR